MKVHLNNMDQVFRDKLENFQHTPPDEVWNNIEQKLDGKKSSNILIYKIAASLAILTFIATLYFYLNRTSYPFPYEITPRFTEAVKDYEYPDKSFKYSTISIADINFVDENRKSRSFLQEEKIIVHPAERINNEEIASLTTLPVAIEEHRKRPDILIKKKSPKQSLFAEIFPEFSAVNHEEFDINYSNASKKWMVGGAIAPSYSYRHIPESNIFTGNSYYNNLESAVFTYSGGLNIQFKAQKKLSIQAGIYYSTMGQDMNYVTVYANQLYHIADDKTRDNYINTYEIVNSAGDIKFNTPLVFIDETATARVRNLSGSKNNTVLSETFLDNMNANIRQSFEYIEVPLIFRYKVLDKTLGINILGGVGANFLVGNNVYLIYDNNKDVIGKTNGVNDINYSGLLGLGLEYPIMNNLNILIEPSLKYYLNPINSNLEIESHPYSLGIYTGVSYSF